MNLETFLDDCKRLQLDTGEVVKAQAQRAEIDRKLVEARRELAGLRPGPNFQSEAQRLSGLLNAYDIALAGSGDDLAEAVNAVKRAALADGGNIDAKRARLLALDTEAVRLLIAFRNVLIDRAQLTEEIAVSSGVLSVWARDVGVDAHRYNLACPGGQTWPGSWVAAARLYFERFLSMAQGNIPGAGEDVLEWFSRRYF